MKIRTYLKGYDRAAHVETRASVYDPAGDREMFVTTVAIEDREDSAKTEVLVKMPADKHDRWVPMSELLDAYVLVRGIKDDGRPAIA